jgi:hypothetical protein
MIGIRFCPVSAARARGIVAGRAKGRIAFEMIGMIGIRFCPVSAARARGIVAGRAKGSQSKGFRDQT